MSKKAVIASTLIVVLAAVAGVFWWNAQPAAQGGGGWPLAQVKLAAVERTPMPHILHAVGELEALRQVQLASEVAGRITRVALTSGQALKAGDIVAQLNDAPEQAERLRLVAQLRNAERVQARAQVLQTSKAVSLEQLDNATAARDMARSELQRTDALIAQKAIRAPFAGVLGIARVHLGQYLNAGDAIASLVDASAVRVNFSLPEGTHGVAASPRPQPG